MTRRPSLGSLRAFDAVARLGSVKLAGNELSVTPGAVSRRIKELESDFGVSFLERDGRGVRLTCDGERLRRGLCPAFKIISKTISNMHVDQHRRKLVLETAPVFATRWLLPRIDRFKRQHPKLEVILSNRFVEANAVDADIVIDWGQPATTTGGERLTQEFIFPVCNPSICHNRTLAGAILLHRHQFPSRYDFPEWSNFLTSVGLKVADPRAGVHVDAALIMDAACSGTGVALANSTIAHDDLQLGRLVRPVDETLHSNVGYCMWIHRAASHRTEVQAFRTWLLDELASSVGHYRDQGGLQ